MNTLCYVALGSNLNSPLAQVKRAAKALAALPQSTLLALSPWYRTRAVGPGMQGDYINGVAMLDTAMTATQLLTALQAIENEQGRQRNERWGARTLDLDLLLVGDTTINNPELTVPHPRMTERNWVIYPLFDIAPDLVLPDGLTVESLRSSCGSKGIIALDNDHGVIA